LLPDIRRVASPGFAGALLTLFATWPIAAAAGNQPLELVADIDLERYQGRWYEVALLPNRFQQVCVAETSANYTLLDDGRMRVVNRCRTAEGDFDSVSGVARSADERPGAFEVRFAPRWLSWLPFVWGDYQVMALDSEYRWALVGAPSRRYLWVLSRQPSLSGSRIEALLAEARRQGFDTDAVVRSPRSGES
jgi:apolipoprotein D and lipocalin family protein